MNVTCEFLLAAENLTMAKDLNNYSYSYKDVPYDIDVFRQILTAKEVKSKSAKKTISFLSTYAFEKEELENIVEGIISYYKECFEFINSDGEQHVKIRIFPYDQSRSRNGDALGSEIRLPYSNIISRMIMNNVYGDNIDEKVDFLGRLDIEPKECEKIGLIYIIAHEIFHIFHGYDYSKNKSLKIEGAFPILREIFAEYFAYSYVDYYISNNTSKEGTINAKKNLIFTNQLIQNDQKMFGVGRKSLMPEFYSEEEIKEDEKYAKECIEKEKIVIDNFNYKLSAADYAGGYILYKMGQKLNDSLQGKDYSLYKDMYNIILEGDPNKALYMMLTEKEKLN